MAKVVGEHLYISPMYLGYGGLLIDIQIEAHMEEVIGQRTLGSRITKSLHKQTTQMKKKKFILKLNNSTAAIRHAYMSEVFSK